MIFCIVFFYAGKDWRLKFLRAACYFSVADCIIKLNT